MHARLAGPFCQFARLCCITDFTTDFTALQAPNAARLAGLFCRFASLFSITYFTTDFTTDCSTGLFCRFARLYCITYFTLSVEALLRLSVQAHEGPILALLWLYQDSIPALLRHYYGSMKALLRTRLRLLCQLAGHFPVFPLFFFHRADPRGAFALRSIVLLSFLLRLRLPVSC